jgi:hypothetical protein
MRNWHFDARLDWKFQLIKIRLIVPKSVQKNDGSIPDHGPGEGTTEHIVNRNLSWAEKEPQVLCIWPYQRQPFQETGPFG